MAKWMNAKVEIGIRIGVVIGIVVGVIGIRRVIGFRRGLLRGGRLGTSVLTLDIRNETLKGLDRLVLFHH
jgi:hypothetical protein